jgi:hypothetical protein
MLKKKSVSSGNLKQIVATLDEVKKDLKDGYCLTTKRKVDNQRVSLMEKRYCHCTTKMLRLQCLFLRRET